MLLAELPSYWRALCSSAVARGSVGALILRAVSLPLGFVVNVMLARLLGPHGLGEFAFAVTTVTALTLPLHGGLVTLIVRESPRYQLQNRWGELKGLLRFSQFSVATHFVVFVLLATAAQLSGLVRSDDLLLWVLGVVLAPLFAGVALRSAVVQSVGRTFSSLLPESLIRPGVMLTVCATCWMLGVRKLLPYQAMIVHVGSVAVALGAATLLVRVALPRHSLGIDASYSLGRWLRSLPAFSVLAGVVVLNSSCALLMLGMLASATDVGLYRAAELFSALVVFPLGAIELALAPQLVKSFAAQDRVHAQRLVAKTAIAATALALPVAIVFIGFGKQILSLYGSQYVQAASILTILSAASFLNVFFGPVGVILNMTGNESESLVGILSGLVLNVALGIVLIPRFGALGAACSTAASTVGWNVLLMWRAYVRTGMRSTAAQGLRWLTRSRTPK